MSHKKSWNKTFGLGYDVKETSVKTVLQVAILFTLQGKGVC